MISKGLICFSAPKKKYWLNETTEARNIMGMQRLKACFGLINHNLLNYYNIDNITYEYYQHIT